MYGIALEFAWPMSFALLLVYLAMGVLARVAPQINMMMVGFPITISIGMLVLLFGVSPFAWKIEQVFQEALLSVERLLASLRV